MIAAPSLLPPTGVLEMTYTCNHRCEFCSCPWFGTQMVPDKEMDIAEWKEVITEFAAAGVTHFSFTGGEAIMKEGLAELLQFASEVPAQYCEEQNGKLVHYQKPPSLNLLSNGRALTEDWIALCAKLKIHLSISLPGLIAFAGNTASNTNPALLLHHFATAKRLGCTTTVGIAVTKRNLHELYETIAAAMLAGADTLLLNRFLPGGRGLQHPELELTPEEVTMVAEIAEKVLKKAGRYGHFGTEMPRCLIEPDKYHHVKIATGCSAARNFFTVGPNGKLRVCNHSPVELLYWRDYHKLGSDPTWMSYIAEKNLPAPCSDCGYRSECAGGCREAARVVL